MDDARMRDTESPLTPEVQRRLRAAFGLAQELDAYERASAIVPEEETRAVLYGDPRGALLQRALREQRARMARFLRGEPLSP